MCLPVVRVDASGTRLVIDQDVREVARCERCGSGRFASRTVVAEDLACAQVTACAACGLVRRTDERGMVGEAPPRRSTPLPMLAGWSVPA